MLHTLNLTPTSLSPRIPDALRYSIYQVFIPRLLRLDISILMLLTVTKLNYNSFVYSIAAINAFIDHVIAHGAEISQILQTHCKVSNRGWSAADQSSLTIASRSNKNTGLSNPLNNYLFMVLLCPSTQSSHISKQQSDLCSNGFFVVFICKIYRFISYGLFNSVYRGQSIQLLPVKFYELYLEYIILVYCLK